MVDEKSINDFNATIRNLEDAITNYYDGNIESYRLIAVQLGILLTDLNPLLPRVKKRVKFYPLSLRPRNKKMTDRKHIKNNDYEYILALTIPIPNELFDINKKKIKLDEWLNQSILSRDYTLKQFIKDVRNKEGAHSDSNINERLKIAHKLFWKKEHFYKLYVIKIGEYVLTECKLEA